MPAARGLRRLAARYLHWARVANVHVRRSEKRLLHAEAERITREASGR